MPFASLRGTRLHYSQNGDGVPLVLLHGFPLDSSVWNDAIAPIENARLILPDLRGFGASVGGGSFTIESLADDVHELLDLLGALPCVLGGLSMGGYVALALAKKYPRDLKGLILIDTRAAGDTPEGKIGRNQTIELAKAKGSKAVAAQMLPKMVAGPDHAAAARKIMESCPPLTIQHACAAMRDREDYSDFLKQIRIPTLIVVGESDAITPPALAREMEQSIAGARLVEIPGAGHLSPLEKPAEVGRAIDDFLKSGPF